MLFLTHYTIRLRTYKYALVVVDVASRYVDAQALTSKDSSKVVKAFEKIYSRKLSFPNTIIVDPGKDFMGDDLTNGLTNLIEDMMFVSNEVKLKTIELRLW